LRWRAQRLSVARGFALANKELSVGTGGWLSIARGICGAGGGLFVRRGGILGVDAGSFVLDLRYFVD